MTVRIDSSNCNGCGDRPESRCAEVCPGDLLFRNEKNKCAVREKNDCWDCAACIKECPRQAIEMFLPVQIGGRGSTLKAVKEKNRVVWKLFRADGTEEIFEIINTNVSEVNG